MSISYRVEFWKCFIQNVKTYFEIININFENFEPPREGRFRISWYFLAWGWNSGQSSPTSTKDFKKFVVIRVAGDEKNEAGLSRY